MRWVSLCVCVSKGIFFSDSLCCLWDNSHTHTHAHSHTRRHTHKHMHTQTHTSDRPLLLYLKWPTLIWTVTPFTGMSWFMLTFTVVQAWVQFSVLNQRERTFSICKNSYSGWVIPVLLLLFLVWFDLIWFQRCTDTNISNTHIYASAAVDPLYVLELSLCVLLFHLFWPLASWHSTCYVVIILNLFMTWTLSQSQNRSYFKDV